MTQSLAHLLPVLSTIPGVNIPVSVLQGISIAASGRKIEQLEQALRHEVGLLTRQIEAGELHLDSDYAGSDAFTANVIQALRAAEIAEGETKLHFIARALAGCSLYFPPPSLDKVQTMRVIEGLSERELKVFTGLFGLLDPIDPYSDSLPTGSAATVGGLTRQEFAAALLGLGQLGLLTKETVQANDWSDPAPAWKLTALARQVATLSRVGPKEL
ncbi:hypothetical protein [Deinococcus altitudinis]|uniref:hypothetical protein n=1 Tax=Deinococcus altitudinis TaxID=468914 RepID=UPI0038917027